MRLTLRTLLAYLDDVLEPAQTKLIGQKIQESAVAGKLVSLIKLVVRQRRLKAPSISGPNMGIDPNVVAQYLDNTLEPEQVVDVEKVLLTSDELLAEVASCHQVMALVMGKPSELSEASRERLYALGPVDRSSQLQVDEPRPLGGSQPSIVANDGQASQKAIEPNATKPEIPEYLRRNSWSQRAFPAAIVALLILVCLGLLIADPSFLNAFRQVKQEFNKPDREASVTDSTPQAAATLVAESNNSEVADAVHSKTPATDIAMSNPPAGEKAPIAPSAPGGIDPLPPPDVTLLSESSLSILG